MFVYFLKPFTVKGFIGEKRTNIFAKWKESMLKKLTYPVRPKNAYGFVIA